MSTQPVAGGAIPEIQLHHRLRIAREFAGLEQTVFAERTGISRATISAAENGHRAPQKSTVKLWALATGVSVEWLETGELKNETPSPDGDGVSSPLPDLNRRPALYEFPFHRVAMAA